MIIFLDLFSIFNAEPTLNMLKVIYYEQET